MNVERIKLIVSEIDGVITDGKFAEDEIGNALYKVFNGKDFDAINKIKSLGYKFVFLSDDNRINYNMCQRRNIPFYWGKNTDEKFKCLGEIFRRYGVGPDETIYIPSKLSDYRCVQTVPNTICPSDVCSVIHSMCSSEFVNVGGSGILVDLLDLLMGKSIIQEISV